MNPALMQLSPTARYALCGMASMANRPAGHYALVEEVAVAEKMPRHFLAKIFQQLAQRGFLLSRRGPGGGYALAKAPEKVPIMDVLSALESIPSRSHCFLENRSCQAAEPCLMHDAAQAAADLLLKALQKMTLADLAQAPGTPLKRAGHV